MENKDSENKDSDNNIFSENNEQTEKPLYDFSDINSDTNKINDDDDEFDIELEDDSDKNDGGKLTTLNMNGTTTHSLPTLLMNNDDDSDQPTYPSNLFYSDHSIENTGYVY